jgi:putative peptide zinc metalloprotease protein
MSERLFSPLWYRVADLVPRLRQNAKIQRQQFRGETWFVLQDLSSERFHRFSTAGYFVIGLMDGRRTVHEIWEAANARLGDDAPNQDEMIRLLGQLHGADVLQCDVSPDTGELLQRYQKQRRKEWQGNLLSVFSWKIPLFDPEKFLQRLLFLVSPFLGWAGLCLWLGLVIPAITLAGLHWPELSRNVLDRVMAPKNLIMIWLLFPLIKALHELGHAFVTKAFGGEVHDMGVMILVLTPVPYVNASAAWGFGDKWRRVLVGAAGMMVELFIASIALFIWLNAESGLVHMLAYNTMLIAGISTLLFNANPLLRFDGYYILSDLIEIPNLRGRSNAYIGHLVEKYLFKSREAGVPASAGERAWFFSYAVTSFLYRMTVIAALIFFIAGKFFMVGILLASLAAIVWAIIPLGKGVSFLLTSPRIHSVRARAILVSTPIAAAAGIIIYFIPVPMRTQTEGVVWLPDEAFVRAGTDGVISEIKGVPGSFVHRDDILVVSEDPALSADAAVLEARLSELKARYAEQVRRDLVKAQIIQQEMGYVEQDLAHAREKLSELVVRSHSDGTFVVPNAVDLPGRFARHGEVLGYVVNLDTMTVRAVVPQRDVELVRQRVRHVKIRLAENVPRVISAEIKAEVPSAVEKLPSTALGLQGGGEIAIDPRDPQGVKVMEKVFQFDLGLPPGTIITKIGGRAYVRFDYGTESLFNQWQRRIRQLFLSRLNV